VVDQAELLPPDLEAQIGAKLERWSATPAGSWWW
jgi:hypothetical protein